MNKRIILGATSSVVEPLALLHLNSIAKQEGYTPKIVLAKDGFEKFDNELKEFNPSILGMTCYTGNHNQVFNYLDTVRKRGIKVILGGPHASYFPRDSSYHSDYVVISEGWNSFRSILQGKAPIGIVPLIARESFPESDREDFYKDNKEYNDSPIKSVIASTGCPYSCTYCYNSSTMETLENVLNETQKEEMKLALSGNRLFPKTLRSVDEIVKEVETIKRISPQTKMLFFQDDIFGVNLEWLKEFEKKYSKAGLPFHAQMRFEYANPGNSSCRDRLNMIKNSGCTGLTFAIESANPIVREEVLNRKMDDYLIVKSLDYLNGLRFKVRTEQILGLPTAATSKETPINLEADLEVLAFNVKLKKETGLPTMAWASIFAPYKGTKIAEYCDQHGFYSGINNDVPETFFQRSVLKFPKHYVGPSLKAGTGDWLSEEEVNKYRDDMVMLRDLFSFFAMVPEGEKLAERFIKDKDKSYGSLSKNFRRHIYDEILYDVK